MKFFIVIAALLTGCSLALDVPPSPSRDCSMSDVSAGPVSQPTDINDLVRRRQNAERLGYCKAQDDVR